MPTISRTVAVLVASLALTGLETPAPTAVNYVIRIDSAGATEISVVMSVRNAPADFRVAMAAHTEYDDQYWRYLTDLTGTSTLGAVSIAREDSSLWRVSAPAGEVVLRYRVQFPDPPAPPLQQSSWKAHLRPNGGLIGGPHSLLYVVGAEHTPARLKLQLPSGWNVATGLERVAGSDVLTAPDAITLIDSPVMVGMLRQWSFPISGVGHTITFLGARGGVPFDTARLVSNVERLARETVQRFSPMPYRSFQFLFEDAASGGLEHVNSVSIGTLSTSLARNPDAYLDQIAHEFFHIWNEVDIRPGSWIGLRHDPPTPTGELWFSEGVTLNFADLILRGAGLPTPDSTRIARLERLMAQYLANPSQATVSPEETSRAFNMLGATGDYTPSIFTQGDLLGTMLDLMIRDGSGGRRSLDDVVRALAAEFSPSRGIVAADIERAVSTACSCDSHAFFATYVASARPLDFDRRLGVLGLTHTVSWSPARAADSSLVPDRRVLTFVRPGETRPRLQIQFPETAFGKAGFHTGDRVISWNGTPIDSISQLRTLISQLRISDSVRLVVERPAGWFERTVTIGGYDRPTVRISRRADATEAQRALLAQWFAGSR